MTYTPIPLTHELEITHLISLLHLKQPRNFCFAGESHDFWELVYVDQGKVLITAGKNQYLLKAGELAFHKPNEFHAIQAYENTSANLIISAFVCKSSCMDYFIHRFTTLNTREREYLYDALRMRHFVPDILTESPKQKDTSENIFFGYSHMVRANLEMLLLTLILHGESQCIQKRIESYAQQTETRQGTQRIKEYLQGHIMQALTLQQISVDLGYSVPQMKKLFHRDTQRSIIDYFIELKIDEAKRLMQEGNMSITQIALYLGYKDISYFSRQFKQREDMTPREYCMSFE